MNPNIAYAVTIADTYVIVTLYLKHSNMRSELIMMFAVCVYNRQ